MPGPSDDHSTFDRLPEEDSPFEDLRDVLADPYGRAAVAYLYRTNGAVDLDDLARGVLGLVEDCDPGDVNEESVRHVRTWLHHGHLPALERYAVVDYDPESGEVRLFQRNPEAN